MVRETLYPDGLEGSTAVEKMCRLLLQPNIKSELKNLIKYQGLWTQDTALASLSSVSSLPGHEHEIIKYLKAINEFWGLLPDGAADKETVRRLNLLCPFAPQDATTIKDMFDENHLFQDIPAKDKKDALDKVLNSNFVFIPTFHSLNQQPTTGQPGRSHKTHPFEDQLKQIHSGEGFEGAYRRLWRYILSYPPLKPLRNATKDMRKTLNIILDKARSS